MKFTDDEIKRMLQDIKLSGNYKCIDCKKKEFIKGSERHWVKCVNCGRKESPTANTVFDGAHMPLSIAMEILLHMQETYLEAEADAEENSSKHWPDPDVYDKGDDGIDYYFPSFSPRASLQELAERFKVGKNSISGYFKRLKNWLPLKYQRKSYSMKEWVKGIRTKENIKTYYALFNLLFNDNGQERTATDILHHIVLKKPEDIEKWMRE